MIVTQSYDQINMPDLILLGIRTYACEPIDSQGYGSGILEATAYFNQQVDDHHILVNSKLTERPGSAHPSYGRKVYTLTGDLYARI